VRRASTSPPYVTTLSRKCGTLNISYPYGHPGLVTGMAYALLCIDDVRTQEKTQVFVCLLFVCFISNQN
jgi:hypothetical protein